MKYSKFDKFEQPYTSVKARIQYYISVMQFKVIFYFLNCNRDTLSWHPWKEHTFMKWEALFFLSQDSWPCLLKIKMTISYIFEKWIWNDFE